MFYLNFFTFNYGIGQYLEKYTMKTFFTLLISILFFAVIVAFTKNAPPQKQAVKEQPHMLVAHLSRGDTSGLAAIRQAFVQRNQGYDVAYYNQVLSIPAADKYRIAFVQQGGGTAELTQHGASKISVGDIVYLDKGEKIATDSLIDYLVFTVPKPMPAGIPAFIRPDWDENITDTPGGCATETNAYRRILLTWKGEVGPYLYHALNAHRVRIMDSFTHYHPVNGGFDEFYLVQMVMPKAKLITSPHVNLITHPDIVTSDQADELLNITQLQVGDFVYLPRGIVHRGLDGVLAQVITVPGFIPGSEIGVDHHLRNINEKLSLKDQATLLYNEEASRSAVIR